MKMDGDENEVLYLLGAGILGIASLRGAEICDVLCYVGALAECLKEKDVPVDGEIATA